MSVSINTDKCTNCGDCEEVCPNDVFNFDFTSCEVTIINQENCDGCKDCLNACQEDAIIIDEES